MKQWLSSPYNNVCINVVMFIIMFLIFSPYYQKEILAYDVIQTSEDKKVERKESPKKSLTNDTVSEKVDTGTGVTNKQENPKNRSTKPVVSSNLDCNDTYDDLAWEMLRENRKGVACPYGLQIILSLLKEGATPKSNTEIEIAKVLGTNLQGQELLEKLKLNVKGYNQEAGLSVYCGMWLRKGSNCTPKYKELFNNITKSKVCTESEVNYIDFTGQPRESIDAINEWFSKRTNGKISKVFDKIESDIKLIIGNTVLFKANWRKAFEKNLTKQEEFTNADGTKEIVSMMNKTEKMYYTEETLLKSLRVPYSNDMSLVIILPEKNSKSLSYIIEELNGEKFDKLLKRMQPAIVNLHLPKFQQRTKMDLKTYLNKSGMKAAFESNAELSGINGKNDLYVGAIGQEVYIDVDENGTEAAAATFAKVLIKGMPRKQTNAVDFYVNRPFIYAIVTNDESFGQNRVLFVGLKDSMKNTEIANNQKKSTIPTNTPLPAPKQ